MATTKNAIPVKLERKSKNLLNQHVAYGIWTMLFWAIKMSMTVRYIKKIRKNRKA